jgi:alanyl-tRNA synthetase
VAEERGFTVDRAGFDALMGRAKEQARAATNLGYAGDAGPSVYEALLANHGKTAFTGYDEGFGEGRVLAIVRDGAPGPGGARRPDGRDRARPDPVLRRIGGQVGDAGILEGPVRSRRGRRRGEDRGIVVHKAKVSSGTIRFGEALAATIEAVRRDAVRRAHTATHLLHAALRAVLGEHVKQAGSKVEPDRLRFDFAHFEALKPEQVEAVERIIAREVIRDAVVETAERDLEEAIGSGATALFDENTATRCASSPCPASPDGTLRRHARRADRSHRLRQGRLRIRPRRRRPPASRRSPAPPRSITRSPWRPNCARRRAPSGASATRSPIRSAASTSA